MHGYLNKVTFPTHHATSYVNGYLLRVLDWIRRYGWVIRMVFMRSCFIGLLARRSHRFTW